MSTAGVRNRNLDDALEQAEERYRARNPGSAARHEAACASLPGGNTRTILHFSPFPLTIAKGEGARLIDIDGHVYTDYLNEYTAGLYGHSSGPIAAAVKRALDDGLVLGGPNRYEAELAALICARFPSCDKVRMCNSGTEANINALGLARAVTGRSHVLVFENAYHGGVLTFGAGDASPMNVPYPVMFAVYNDLDGTRRLLRENADKLAAVIIEPMMGSAGAIPAEPTFLTMLREETQANGIVLVFDEVMTSRLSLGGLQARLGIVPDLTSFGKYLGGGLTFGAFGGSDALMARLDPARPDALLHSGTYNNNVLTMAAGVAGLTEVLTPEAVEAVNAKGDELRETLNAVAVKRGVPAQVTGIGSLMCIHLHDRPIRSPADAEPSDARMRALFHLEMLERGVYMARRGFISLSLPLTDEDHQGFAEAFDDVLMLLQPYLRAGEATG